MGSFEHFFGAPRVALARAYGRVNLIGEHTDYNDGFVLPTLIPQFVQVELRPREDGVVRIASPDIEAQPFTYRIGEEKAGHHWADYAQGVTRVLTQEKFAIGGFDALVTSTVPVGSGLSSSAAFLIGVMKALREAYQLDISDLRLARTAQRVENEFVGARVGIMDPMVVSLGDAENALFIDTQSLSFRKIPLMKGETDLVVINSGVSHRNASGGYNRRRAECEEACRQLSVSSLREVEDESRLAGLPEVLQRRARHVISENRRVLSAVDALQKQDAAAFGALLGESHRSLKDDYEVSVPAIDTLVDIAMAEPGVFGARLTGGGFGGSIVALVRRGEAHRVARHIVDKYAAVSPHVASILIPPSL